MEFKGLNILNGYQFTNEQLYCIMDTAQQYERRLKERELIRDMEGMVIATMFFEPSTRTRMSFEAAVNRMGATYISMSDAKASSTTKGETLEDTIRTVDGYVDAIVMRHPEKGSAVRAAQLSEHPIINGGDGAGQHPTQALLDIYTMREEKGHIGGQTITFLGDLKHGRTVHSLCYMMKQLGNKLIFASPKALRMPEEIMKELRSGGCEIVETDDVRGALAQSDFMYVTRIQRERFSDLAEYEKCKGSYIVNRELIKAAKPGITIMHPLPRVDEISLEVDNYEGAAYFRQAHNGMCVRMALLGLVTGRACVAEPVEKMFLFESA